MSKVKFVEAVISLHEIARLVEEELEHDNLSGDIRNCADRLHVAALGVRIAEAETNNLINKAKE